MKKIFLAFTVLFAFLIAPLAAIAEDNNGAVCDPVDQEGVLKKGIDESPDLLVAILEGEKLGLFWEKMREAQLMGGPPLFNKVYIFKSENHPDSVYVFFLSNGCIYNVVLTYKNLVESFLQP